MKKYLALFLAPLLVFGLAGCSSYQKAEAVYHVIDGIIGVAQADLPSLQATGVFSPSSAAVAGGYLTVAAQLNDQYKSCIDNAQNTKLATSGKFLACLNVLSTGLADPKELSALRILNSKEQKQIQLWVTTFQVALNAGIAGFGGQQEPPPVVTQAPTSAELHAFESRVKRGL